MAIYDFTDEAIDLVLHAIAAAGALDTHITRASYSGWDAPLLRAVRGTHTDFLLRAVSLLTGFPILTTDGDFVHLK